jgi:preprotein translocase subunit SecE
MVLETLMNPADWYRDTRQYFVEVGSEYRKITWPPQKEAAAGAVGVVVVVLIVTMVLGIVDFGLSRIMQMVLQQ